MIFIRRGFTVTELLVGLVIGAIVLLMFGGLGTIASKSFKDLRDQSSVYNDTQFGLSMIREDTRQSTAVPTVSSGCLSITTAAGTKRFYVQGTSLVYSTTTCGSTTNNVIISGVTNLVFTPSVSGQLVTVSPLSGRKNNVTFNYSINVARRNP